MRKKSDQLSLQRVARWLERDGVQLIPSKLCGVEKDKPTLLVKCFYDLLTARQYFLPTVNGGCDVTGNWWEPAGLAGEENTAKFEYEFTTSHKVNGQEWQDDVVLLFFHLLILILAPDPPKVNNEQVNSDHLPPGSRPLRERETETETEPEREDKIILLPITTGVNMQTIRIFMDPMTDLNSVF